MTSLTGTIDFREFTIALSKLSQGTIRQKLSLAFYLYDENCDGVLSFDEVLGIVEVIMSLLAYVITFLCVLSIKRFFCDFDLRD